MAHSLTGWDIANAHDVDWTRWGASGDARAKLLVSGDGFNIALVQADAGYLGAAHVHDYPEFLYVILGVVRTQGLVLAPGGVGNLLSLLLAGRLITRMDQRWLLALG